MLTLQWQIASILGFTVVFRIRYNTHSIHMFLEYVLSLPKYSTYYYHQLWFSLGSYSTTRRLPGETSTGVCAKLFQREKRKCRYGLRFVFYPACCDRNGCKCTCIYICETKKGVRNRLNNAAELHDFENSKCTNKVISRKHGKRWRDKECRHSTKRKGTQGCEEFPMFILFK